VSKIQYYVASTLDGFIADEHDDLSWLLQFGMADFSEHYDLFDARGFLHTDPADRVRSTCYPADFPLSAGDRIYAVIKGSALNNDGSAKVGYTAPSVEGQAEVIAMAQAMAEIDADTVSYVEAHGTATPLGDPIEIAALTQAFRGSSRKTGFCAIGSVKSNIGHLDPAAGVAGLIKTVLMLEHKKLPPSLHFVAPNPQIDFANSPFVVNAKLRDWVDVPTPRRAGVSSFGIGGTNAHVVLEETPVVQPASAGRPAQLIVLSARTSSALETATRRLRERLRDRPDLDPADVAYTCQVGRRAFNHRRMLVCRGLDDAGQALDALDPRRVLSAVAQGEPRVAFMFSGQGAQYVDMGRGLFESEPAFREQIERCSQLLAPHLAVPLLELLYPGTRDDDAAGSRLQQTAFTQPALFCIEYALAMLWMQWGVRPAAMIGHSIGEYVAACLAGVFSLEDALRIVAARGRLMQQLPAGSMLAVSMSPADVQPLLGDQLDLAAVNGPSLCVVSGPTEAVKRLEASLVGKRVRCRLLQTSHAFHSRMMEPALTPFAEVLRQVSLQPPRLPYLSNVSGDWITAGMATNPDYWVRHLRETVCFGRGLGELLKDPALLLLEIGPGTALSSIAAQHPGPNAARRVFSTLRHPNDRQPDAVFALHTLGQLWLAGVKPDWHGLHAHERRRRVPLPTYPFERRRFWIEPAGAGQPAARTARPPRRGRPRRQRGPRPAPPLAARRHPRFRSRPRRSRCPEPAAARRLPRPPRVVAQAETARPPRAPAPAPRASKPLPKRAGDSWGAARGIPAAGPRPARGADRRFWARCP